MTVYVNTSGRPRYWPSIINPATGRTLELEPGESADLDLPEGFSSPHLTAEQESPAAAKARAAAQAAADAEAEAAAAEKAAAKAEAEAAAASTTNQDGSPA